jgi:hypothetical protein
MIKDAVFYSVVDKRTAARAATRRPSDADTRGSAPLPSGPTVSKTAKENMFKRNVLKIMSLVHSVRGMR